jgi:hypothetical protein
VNGHLFVVRGDLTRLAADAVLVPSGWQDGRLGHVGSDAWDELLGDHLDADRFVHQAPDEARRVCEVRRLVGGPAVWVGHTGDDEREPGWYGEAASRFVEAAGRAGRVLSFRPLGHERPLLALPLLGVGLGGMAARKGEVVVACLESIVAAMARVDADVALVLADDQAFAAALQARQRVLGDRGWAGLELHREAAADLARRGRAKQLVLFVGSGASMGAGGRSWKELLRELAVQAGLGEPRLTELVDRLDARDAGQVLAATFGAAELRRRVVELTTIERPSLLHQLLASLPAEQAVTTNYDEGLELSFAAAGRPLPVLPQAEATRWLLKLHGSVDRPGSIVLSRDDYLRWEEHGAAFGAVVQALLLTRHLLFVGYGLGDDNLHRLMHGVRAALGGREHRIGEVKLATVVAAAPESLGDQVWEEDLRFVRVAAGPDVDAHAAACFLDLVVSLTAAPAAHLLDPSYAFLFSDAELAFGHALRGTVSAAHAAGVPAEVRSALHDALAPFGVGAVDVPTGDGVAPDPRLTALLEDVERLGPPETWPAPDGYPGLALCVLDAVWSIGVRYEGVVNVVDRYRALAAGQGRDADQDGPAELLTSAAAIGGPEALAEALGNRQRTSTRSGILKAEAVLLTARILADAEVQSTAALLALSPRALEGLRADFVAVRGQGSGLSFDYLLMLAGRPGVKSDRMIRRFVARATGAESADAVTVSDAQDLVTAAAAALGVDAHRLDSAIWTSMARGGG